MKTLASIALFTVAFVIHVVGQMPNATDKQIIFAVLHDGRTLEPVAFIADKKLESAFDGATESELLAGFHRRYFKSKTSYQLVFGGAKAGTAVVKSSDPEAECSRHTAESTITTTRTTLKGNVMALAVSSSIKLAGSGVRRMPTAAERLQIESLVRAELMKQKISAAVVRKLRYQNLTAVDVDGDDVVEFVGSYWVQPTLKSRALLFFIADKASDGKYKFGFSEFGRVTEEETMSSDITTVDAGVGHEVLLDLLDYDGDGTSEIITYDPGFEGAGFNAYRRENGKWIRTYEGGNYRCGY